MTKRPYAWLTLAAGVNGFLAVAAGAYGAHGVQWDEARDAAFQTAADYHLTHSIVVLALGCLASLRPRTASLAGAAFVLGMLIFCGSLYYSGLTGSRDWLWLTPIGGGLLLLGWLVVVALGIGVWRNGPQA